MTTRITLSCFLTIMCGLAVNAGAKQNVSIAPQQAATLPETVERISRSLVVVSSTAGRDAKDYGTGFCFRKDGYILTANHLIQGQNPTVSIIGKDMVYKSYTAKVIAQDTHLDIAIIKCNTVLIPIRFSVTPPRPGDEIATVGFPFGPTIDDTFIPTTSAGVVACIRRLPAADNIPQSFAPASNGTDQSTDSKVGTGDHNLNDSTIGPQIKTDDARTTDDGRSDTQVPTDVKQPQETKTHQIYSWQIQLDLNIEVGNSGGPIFSPAKGDVMGIVVANLTDSRTGLQVNRIAFAIPSTAIIDFIHKNVSDDTNSNKKVIQMIK